VGLLCGGAIENVSVTGGRVHAEAIPIPGLAGGIVSAGGIAGAIQSGTLGAKPLVNKCTSDATINSGTILGGLIGIASGSVTNSSTTCNINVPGGVYVGGLIGYFAGDSTVVCSNNYTTGAINCGNDNIVGGLIAEVIGGKVKNCYTTGNISGSIAYGGGLIGVLSTATSMNFYNNAYCTVSSCYATGSISTNYVGCIAVSGLIGSAGLADSQHFIKITDCYASGTIDAGSAGEATGIADMNVALSSTSLLIVKNCFYSGIKLSGISTTSNSYHNNNVNGIVIGGTPTPSLTFPFVSIQNVYANSSLTKNFTGHFDPNVQLINIATFTTNPGAVIKTTAPFLGFDFANTWAFNSGNWPTLKNMP